MPHAPIRRLACALLLACASAAAGAATLTVSAAASLTEVLKAIGARYEAEHPGVTLQFNFAASGVLLQQIAQGAPVDLFVSADEESVAKGLAQKLLDPASRRNIASNQLVLIVPAQGAVALHALADLNAAAVGHVALGKPTTVPAGRYARAALESAGLWDGLQARLVYAESVRQVLDYVARGEAEAGFVYATDAALMPGKVHVALTVGDHAPVRYPAALVSEGRQKALASEFLAYLTSAPARQLLAQAGFGAP